MAQHDYILANQSGAAFRSDINNGLAAIVSQNSGAAQPSTTYAYQWWADTTTGLLKIRNSANSAWITIGTLADVNLGLLAQSGGTLTGALLADDSGTAALPAIAFDGDPNTGIFRPAADQFGIATNGVERVEFGTTEVVFNDGGADVDFRVEGDTKANLFKVDAGADTVIIDGLTHPSVDGTADQALVTNGSGVLSFASRSRLVRTASVSLVGGTSATFTSIPSWVKRFTIVFDNLGVTNTDNLLIQLGDSGGPENSGYVSTAGYMTFASPSFAGGVISSIYGVILFIGALVNVSTGSIVFNNISGNRWIATGQHNFSNLTTTLGWTAGEKTLSGTLDRVVVLLTGSDTFDSGSVNIIYEG